jgi:hypothetical protein
MAARIAAWSALIVVVAVIATLLLIRHFGSGSHFSRKEAPVLPAAR